MFPTPTRLAIPPTAREISITNAIRPIMMHFLARVTVCFCAVVKLLLLSSYADAQVSVDFNRQIRPILAENCFQCHGPDANQRSGDLRLDVEAEAKKAAIVSNHADSSPLIERIVSDDPDVVMPPPATGKHLTDVQKQLLRKWIDEGAGYAAHWAFQPIESADKLLRSLPKSEFEDAKPIDRFLIQKLRSSGLQYSAEITKSQFIRRVTFDLTGLPPTWDEIDSFVNDSSEDAYDRLVNRLLESPRYGERWGRHWLDIARYADTHGGSAIGFLSFPFSYTYRDYVIKALNNNLPFDRFIQEQIAADQLGMPEDDPSLAALGFLTVGMQFRNSHDTIDDQIDVISRGLMGLTVTCARCHDHKFDPITAQDYYSIYASIAPSKSPQLLPKIGDASEHTAQMNYERELKQLTHQWLSLARDQSEVMRNRLRMQVGLYMTEIAKGVGEQDLSTQFLSYRTDDIRPLIFNRWRSYLGEMSSTDPVFGPWVEMQSWGKISTEEFSKRREEYVAKLVAELEAGGRTADKLHGLRAGSPKWNPFVVDALVESNPTTMIEVAQTYGKVFIEEQKQWQQAIGEASMEATGPDQVLPDDHPKHVVINSPSHRQLRDHLYGSGSPFDVADDEAMRLTNRTISDLISSKRAAIYELHSSSPGSPPRAMALKEDPKPKEYHVFVRGNPLARGERVQPRFLSVLPRDASITFQDGKRRLGLASSITSSSNPLTKRVIVNWAWQHHFGVGLVRTPDDFGTRGQSPTHPELLDYLADEFGNHGWDLKWLHRQIVLSKAYRQGAVENEASRQTDPENSLLWRMPRRRLDFEAMRDAMLAVCDELDTSMGGRPIDLNASPAIPRRSVYGFINRDIIANLMSTFDSANPNACTAKRPETTVPQQTLFALNSDFIQDRAARLAALTESIQSDSPNERIIALVKRILGRRPTDSEIKIATEFLNEIAVNDAATTGSPDVNRRWTQLAHALLASNEFIFLD